MGFQGDGRRYIYLSDVPRVVKGSRVLNGVCGSVDSTDICA